MDFTIKNFQKFRGIPEFEELSLPALTIITGINGVGKSNLLRGLSDGRIRCSSIGSMEQQFGDALEHEHLPPRPNVVLLTSRDALPENFSATSAVGFVDVRPTADTGQHQPAVFTEKRRGLLAQHLVQLRSLVSSSYPIPEPSDDWDDDIWAKGADDLIQSLSNADITHDDAAIRRCFDLAQQDLIEVSRYGALGMYAVSLEHYAERLGKTCLAISPDDIHRGNDIRTLERFNTKFSDAFALYIRRHHENIAAIARGIYSESTGGLSAKRFTQTYGPPPWNVVNDALSSMGLNYEVVAPSFDVDSVAFAIRRKMDGQPISLNELSSGEQVLLQFALSTYSFDEANLSLTVPKLLLLDEMDASLHPAFVARWIASVRGLAESVGVSVVLTTHSPTTVALAPEGSVFEMTQADPIPRGVTRQHAIDRLTYGLPVLTIDASARRQVFVESSNDARWYEALAGQLKGKIDFKRGLSFVSARKEKPTGEGGDDAGGCSLARSIVENLTAEGVPSLFGLLDFDNGRNLPTERIVVLADGSHYAIENVLLDPLLIGAVLIRGQASEFDYPVTMVDLLSNDTALLQRLVDFIAEKVPFEEDSQRQSITSSYFGGFELSVPAGFQTMKGHKLLELVCLHLPPLGRWAGKGRLLDTIIAEVIGMNLGLCPQAIVDALTALSNSQVVHAKDLGVS